MQENTERAGLLPVLAIAFSILFSVSSALSVSLMAQTPDEVTTLLQQYVRIDTSNPPGNTSKAKGLPSPATNRNQVNRSCWRG